MQYVSERFPSTDTDLSIWQQGPFTRVSLNSWIQLLVNFKVCILEEDMAV